MVRERSNKMKNKFLILLLIITTLFSGCRVGHTLGMVDASDPAIEYPIQSESGTGSVELEEEVQVEPEYVFDLSSIPSYNGKAYVTINNNVPNFSTVELTTTSFERYSDLDQLGRCGVVIANIGKDIMPTVERGSIGMVKPSGWHTVKYDCVDGRYLYNRCHLIGYQLSGENATVENLITGTRYMNIEGMLPFENEVADYVQATNNHVLYRATPVFEGNNLLASGVLIEAMSVEDNGQGIKFHVFCYNVQPGIIIDYSNGASRLADDSVIPVDPVVAEQMKQADYICNTNTKKFHYPECKSVKDMKEKNKKAHIGSREELIQQGFSPCGNCKP